MILLYYKYNNKGGYVNNNWGGYSYTDPVSLRSMETPAPFYKLTKMGFTFGFQFFYLTFELGGN